MRTLGQIAFFAIRYTNHTIPVPACLRTTRAHTYTWADALLAQHRLWGMKPVVNRSSRKQYVMPEKPTKRRPYGTIGQELNRPECALWHPSGLVIVPSWQGNGGISLVNAQNRTRHILSNGPITLRPNGIALEHGGTVLLAHMGDTQGGIYRLHADGSTDALVMTVNGDPMPPTNFVVKDAHDRLWITVSTRKTPRALDYRSDAHSGFVAVAEPGSSDARIVADNLGYTNECVIDESRGHVYVNETFGRRLTRFNLHERGGAVSLNKPQVIAQFDKGTYPDGLAMDNNGGLWVTSIVSNRIIHIDTHNNQNIVLEDSDEAHLDIVEQAYASNSLGRKHLDNVMSQQLKNISNAAFGGPDNQRLYLGNLLGSDIPFVDVEASGAAMVHWEAGLGPLQEYV